MNKFSKEVRQLLEYVGGKENIAAVTHCVTRMRFVLNNPQKADVEKIERIKVVKGTFTQAGQFQVIIGNEVATFYNEFVKNADIEGVSKETVKKAGRQNMNFLQRLISHLGEIFSPLIPAIIVGGLILGFRNIIGDIKLLEGGTKSLIEVSQFWAGVHQFLWLIGEAIFFFLPVGITWSISKKWGQLKFWGLF
ncbi:PTS system, glucose-like IIB component [Tepidibacter thalassicus DSM 15285]|uniref:PTS system, glucose-like IIB component n=1 Tax=Tepidibacter thalassicus DSM 15285 TaxID=1123350 RepID=A0A1M5TFC3_9FIRM|nr:glucose PTS transporter subunit EIIB [Tepidibacter thalassicus]SHH49432.1 PTS system, glucose-like IIB component [Tepidibacter thalassicus DSM 15285]